MKLSLVLSTALLLIVGVTAAQTPMAARPPMGMELLGRVRAYDHRPQFRENVDVLAAKLKPFGWIAAWAPYARPGTWPGADMLPLGYPGPHPGDGEARESRLTHAEQQTMVTLWSIARSPLILGADLTKLDDWTTQLLTNGDVLDVNQFGRNQRRVAREGNTVAWTAEGKGTLRYLALFNLNDQDKTINGTYSFYNLPAGSYHAQELWTHMDRGVFASIHVTLPPHSCVLMGMKP